MYIIGFDVNSTEDSPLTSPRQSIITPCCSSPSTMFCIARIAPPISPVAPTRRPYWLFVSQSFAGTSPIVKYGLLTPSARLNIDAISFTASKLSVKPLNPLWLRLSKESSPCKPVANPEFASNLPFSKEKRTFLNIIILQNKRSFVPRAQPVRHGYELPLACSHRH